MTYDELLAKIDACHKSKCCTAGGSDRDVPKHYNWDCYDLHNMARTLRAVVELHKPSELEYPDEDVFYCVACSDDKASVSYFYPCKTIKVIEEAIK